MPQRRHPGEPAPRRRPAQRRLRHAGGDGHGDPAVRVRPTRAAPARTPTATATSRTAWARTRSTGARARLPAARCHGTPPGGTHPAGSTLATCGNCHGNYSNATQSIINPAGHVDGSVDLSNMSCTSCHGTSGRLGVAGADLNQASAPPLDSLGASAGVRVGTHASHVNPLAAGAVYKPVACTECHPSNTTNDHSNAIREVNFDLATGAKLTGYAAGAVLGNGTSTQTTCATYCHGATLDAHHDARHRLELDLERRRRRLRQLPPVAPGHGEPPQRGGALHLRDLPRWHRQRHGRRQRGRRPARERRHRHLQPHLHHLPRQRHARPRRPPGHQRRRGSHRHRRSRHLRQHRRRHRERRRRPRGARPRDAVPPGPLQRLPHGPRHADPQDRRRHRRHRRARQPLHHRQHRQRQLRRRGRDLLQRLLPRQLRGRRGRDRHADLEDGRNARLHLLPRRAAGAHRGEPSPRQHRLRHLPRHGLHQLPRSSRRPTSTARRRSAARAARCVTAT